MNLEEIEVSGDFPLDEVREKTRDFEFCMEHIDSYFGKESNLSCTVGKFPEKHSPDYCWGGCPGALQEAMHIFKAYYPHIEQEMKKVRYVVGKVEGPLDLKEDERVIFAGNCTSWEGQIDGEDVRIESSYKTTTEVDEKKTKSNDLLLKTFKTLWASNKRRGKRYLHAKGCPLSVGDHVHYLSIVGKIKNINFDPRMVVSLNVLYWVMRLNRFLKRFTG